MCLSVCVSLSVCLFDKKTPPREMSKGGHIIYGFHRNLSGSVLIYISSLSDQLSGRYWPKTGHRWKNMIKNRRFLEVFEKFQDLPDELST